MEAQIYDIDKLTEENKPRIVISTKKLSFSSCYDAFNPSFIKTEDGYLLTFRHLPDPLQPWLSNIYIVKLDDSFEEVSVPQVLDTRRYNKLGIPSQSEDARIFAFNESIYIIYNDNIEQINPSLLQRRDIYIAEVLEEGNKFVLSKPIKLYHSIFYNTQSWQKNWSPFVYNDSLLFIYSLRPHEVIHADLNSGICVELKKTPSLFTWNMGDPRGGTPALLVDGEFLTFFHSQIFTKSSVSKEIARHHYFMGAYTFSAEPPFMITRYTPSPIIGKKFYTESTADKRVIFPGGFIVAEPYIYLVYGKDDREIWIAVIDKKELYAFMKRPSEKK